MDTEQEKTRVKIFTESFRITGEIELMPGARVTDFILEGKDYFAVTNAEVSDLDGREILKTSFLSVSRQHIQIIAPD